MINDDGAIYFGEVNGEGIPQGKGKIVYPDSSYDNVEWKDVNRFIGDTRTGVNKVVADPLRNLFDDAKRGLKKMIFN